MALQIGQAFTDGVDELLSERGLLFVAAFVLLGLINAVIGQSLAIRAVERLLQQLPESAETQEAITEMTSQFPLALDLPIAVAGVLLVVVFVVGLALRLVAIRAFASESSEPLPDDATDNLVSVVLIAIVAGILTGIATLIGTLLLVLPGLVLAFLFLFVRQEIALNDSGVIESIRNSMGLVIDNPLELFVIVLGLIVLGLVVSLPFQVLGSVLPATITTVLSTILSQTVGVFGIAVVTSAYQQAAAERDGEVDDLAPGDMEF